MNPFRPNTSGEKFFRPPFRLQPIERLDQDGNAKEQRSAEDLAEFEACAKAKTCNKTSRGFCKVNAEVIPAVKEEKRTRFGNSRKSSFNEKTFCSQKSCPKASCRHTDDLDDWLSEEERNKPEVITYRDPHQWKYLCDLPKNMITKDRCMDMKYPERKDSNLRVNGINVTKLSDASSLKREGKVQNIRVSKSGMSFMIPNITGKKRNPMEEDMNDRYRPPPKCSILTSHHPFLPILGKPCFATEQMEFKQAELRRKNKIYKRVPRNRKSQSRIALQEQDERQKIEERAIEIEQRLLYGIRKEKDINWLQNLNINRDVPARNTRYCYTVSGCRQDTAFRDRGDPCPNFPYEYTGLGGQFGSRYRRNLTPENESEMSDDSTIPSVSASGDGDTITPLDANYSDDETPIKTPVLP